MVIPRLPTGFAAMSPAKRRSIAAAGGWATYDAGKTPKFTPAQARAAGRKSGQSRRRLNAERMYRRVFLGPSGE